MAGRKLRGLSARRVLRAFERAGFRVERVAGSHYILARDGSPTISIPQHDPVKVGLLLSKIKLAGLTYEEFEALL
jgi:predicted RNA binding protein YcfA (HicA-like mRNA interferase family)